MKLGANQFLLILFGLLCTIVLPWLPAYAGRAAAASPRAACENSFAGAVYFDQDRSGSYDGTEQYLPGQIEIVDAQGATQQMIQSGDGVFTAHQLACNIYTIRHNQVLVGTVEVGEVMSQEMQRFPKVQIFFLPLVAYQAQ